MPVIQAKSAGFCYGVRRAVELLSSGDLEVGSLVTHRFPLTQIDAAIAAVRERAGLKVAVVPG